MCTILSDNVLSRSPKLQTLAIDYYMSNAVGLAKRLVTLGTGTGNKFSESYFILYYFRTMSLLAGATRRHLL